MTIEMWVTLKPSECDSPLFWPITFHNLKINEMCKYKHILSKYLSWPLMPSHTRSERSLKSAVLKALLPTQKTATKSVIAATGQTYHQNKKIGLHCSLVNWLFLQKLVKIASSKFCGYPFIYPKILLFFAWRRGWEEGKFPIMLVYDVSDKWSAMNCMK